MIDRLVRLTGIAHRFIEPTPGDRSEPLTRLFCCLTDGEWPAAGGAT